MNKKILKYIEEYKGYSLTDWEKEYYSKHYPTIEKFEKDMIYQSISDISKELTGCRHRLDIDKYTLVELQSILNEYIQQNEKINQRIADQEAENFVNNKLLAKSIGVSIEDLYRWEVAW